MATQSRAEQSGPSAAHRREAYGAIPSVHDVVESRALMPWAQRVPRSWIVRLARQKIEEYRERLKANVTLSADVPADQVRDGIIARVVGDLEAQEQSGLRPVINATGILLHTGLGRAPLPSSAVRAIADTAGQYSNVELDLATGRRGSRAAAVRDLICRVTGAEAATVVNNNAAATLLVLVAVASASGKGPRNVVVSRGELIEIGGSFRLPDIMTASGNLLSEVGTTNKTRLSDYEGAINDQTAALMKVHTSNYRVVGFTASVPIGDLVELGRRYDLPVIHDIGSGAIVDLKQFNLRDEPVASESIEAGADLVLFSGDKLLGGPQAGLILGRRAWIERIEKNPLMRALRLDKMTLAALEATLRLYGNPQLAARELPIMAMAAAPVTVLRERAERVAAAVTSLPGIGSVEVQPSVAYLGAGTLPTAEIESVAIRIEPDGMTENELGACLRRGSPPRPPVVPRVQDGAVWLDLRTVMPAQDESLIDALRLACASGHQPA